ncbi:MAG: response regulator [Pleurocapsa sp. MO_226.B13]|nr:response regulator [Pleurocapsa sp. MO_226.B13]
MNNSPQNPLKVLQAKHQETWSGCIEIIEPQDASIVWQVYLLQGKVQYISTVRGQQTRLDYLWQKFKLGSNCPRLKEPKAKVSEYTQICEWLSDKQLSIENIRKLLFMFIREGLTQILSISKTKISFNPAKRIKKSLVSFDLKKIITNEQITAKAKEWQEVKSYCYSPLSRLYLDQKNALKFYKIWKELYTLPELAPLANSQKLSSFVSLFVAKSSLYEIATKAKVDTYFLIKHLKESLETKIVVLLPFAEANLEDKQKNKAKLKENIKPNNSQPDINQSERIEPNNAPSLIVCIDDSKTVQRQVKMTLKAVGYQVVGILDPTMALKELSQHQPAVIFMDINMPNINGYDLCSLLRKSQKFKEVPIVMLTGRDGMIDRVRAKIAGANDYLTKPCDPNKLIALTKMLEKSMVTAS